jgi:hypothetical protein
MHFLQLELFLHLGDDPFDPMILEMLFRQGIYLVLNP